MTVHEDVRLGWKSIIDENMTRGDHADVYRPKDQSHKVTILYDDGHQLSGPKGKLIWI